MNRKENQEMGRAPLHNDPEKNRKYHNEGRDGDNTRKTTSGIEEGDEDYDDEQQGMSFDEQETARENNNS